MLLLLALTAGAGPYLEVRGVAQDGGHPQLLCDADHCTAAAADPSLAHRRSAVAIVDPDSGREWLLDAGPDLPSQVNGVPAGIFVTHAHIGHYTGLMYLGRETLGADAVPVYAMPRLAEFLGSNGPWDQLVELRNIVLKPLADGQWVELTDALAVKPVLVPHRDEYSETVGFVVRGPSKSALYLPDVDKWDKLEPSIESLVAQVDRAWLDGTFFTAEELPGRDMSDIPHPFIAESLERLGELKRKQRARVHFIHFNHSNPVLWDPQARARVEAAGFGVAARGDRLEL